MDLRSLIGRYSKAGPRYTSYPTAPQFSEQRNAEVYRQQLKDFGAGAARELALYVHIPFCESLCYYCGCNVLITKEHGRSESYINTVLKEAGEVANHFAARRVIQQMSWGGGTPTFLSVGEIETLYRGLQKHFDFDPEAEISIEIDPRVTSREQLGALRALGFNRVSLGVQDFDPEVQKAVNRLQSAEMTGAMLQVCRDLGFKGINFDLIYGLPFQTLDRFQSTIDMVMQQRPDRIALYNYAHLPSLRPHQKILEKFPMPTAEERMSIFTMAYDALLDRGYRAIGMDHFALDTDEMYVASLNGSLYRNFMGYTVRKAPNMIGLGASAIGELENGYFQNVREVKGYESSVATSGISVFRGLELTAEDQRRKWIIQSIMCRFKVSYAEYGEKFGESFVDKFREQLSELSPFEADQILERGPDGFKITPIGRLFVRNVAMIFDEYLKKPSSATYSQTL